MFVHDLPYEPRTKLCNILDFNNEWRNLGGSYMKFDCYDLFKMEQAVQRNRSPTEELLSKWSVQNHTVAELFNLLYQMKHFQAMSVLKPFVPTKYHVLIPESCPKGEVVQAPQRTETVVAPREASVSVRRSIEPVPVPVKEQQEVQKRDTNHIFSEATRKVSDPLCSLGGTPHIPYAELVKATNNFDKKTILGSGGFGTVYKGLWKNMAIAIKKLDVLKEGKPKEETDMCQREQSLRELKYLNSCRHDNILPLHGVCFEGGNYCLIYKFMPNGSLDERLRCQNRTKPPLSWSDRLNIAIGTAAGIQFLHSMQQPLVHGDIKSANILLDAHNEPVIGDFGLTQEGPIEKATHITLKKINGTQAYLPYEFLTTKKLSPKVDVYSFGIVCFELATGLKVIVQKRSLKDMVLKSNEDSIFTLFDMNAQPIEIDVALGFIKIGKLCVPDSARQRPDMIQVYDMLVNEKENLKSLNRGTGFEPGSSIHFSQNRMPSLNTNPALVKLRKMGQGHSQSPPMSQQPTHRLPITPNIGMGQPSHGTNGPPVMGNTGLPNLVVNGTPNIVGQPSFQPNVNNGIPIIVENGLRHSHMGPPNVVIGQPSFGKSYGSSQQPKSQTFNVPQIPKQNPFEQPLEGQFAMKPTGSTFQKIKKENENMAAVSKISESSESQLCSASHSSSISTCTTHSTDNSVEILKDTTVSSKPRLVQDNAPSVSNEVVSEGNLPLNVFQQINLNK